MENYHEKLKNTNLFSGMIYSACRMGAWCYSYKNRNMFYSTCPNQRDFMMFFSMSGCLDYIFSEEVDTGKPLFLSDSIGMVWVADYVFQDGKPNLVIVIGPVFNSNSSVRGIEDSLRSLNFSISVRKNLLQILQKVPIVPTDMLYQYASMLHYTVTEEVVTSRDFQFQHSPQTLEEDIIFGPAERISMERVRITEETILQLIREGNPDCRRLMREQMTMNRSDDYQGNLSHRDEKNTMVIFTALCSRAAMEGGLSPRTAKTMEIKYITEVEQAKTMTDLISIREKMMDDFAARVRECRRHPEVSRVVNECCDYIQNNLQKPLELADIAKEMGYTEYYLTKKFYKEMGIRLADYIKDSRIELAKIWLVATQKSIQEISDQMHFGSRSYFSKVFRQKVGMTPAVYREQVVLKTDEKKNNQKDYAVKADQGGIE